MHDATKRFEIETPLKATLPNARAENEAPSAEMDGKDAWPSRKRRQTQRKPARRGLAGSALEYRGLLETGGFHLVGAARTEAPRSTAPRALGRLWHRQDCLIRPSAGTATTGRAADLPLRRRRGRVYPERYWGGTGALYRELQARAGAVVLLLPAVLSLRACWSGRRPARRDSGAVHGGPLRSDGRNPVAGFVRSADHCQAMLDAVSGKQGRRYRMREHLF